MFGKEGLIGVTFLEQESVQGERDREIGARAHGQVDLRLPCQRRRARIDDDQPCPGLLRFAQVRDEVNA